MVRNAPQKTPPSGMLWAGVIGATALANPAPTVPRFPSDGVKLELTFTKLQLATFREFST